MMLFRGEKRGQIAIFVIIGVTIFVGVIVFLLIRGNLGVGNESVEAREVYDYYSECIKEQTEIAVSIASSQGGRINEGEYAPGSDYAPSASHLNFVGLNIPYWYYISANGLVKENVPTLAQMEREISDYVLTNLDNCDFEEFYSRGLEISFSEPKVNLDITNSEVRVDVENSITVTSSNSSSVRRNHEASIQTKLGKLYSTAREVYNKQRKDGFLENYSADVLTLYAPVDGVEIQCNPKIWRTSEVESDLKNGLSSNIAAIKLKGDYYTLNNKRDNYFVVDQKVDESVNFLYSTNWPTKIEIYGEGVDSELMIAEPVGNQEGLGLLGFCYVPYHFVYDINYPVLIQVFDDFEVFQFPVIVVIDNNQPRKAEYTEIIEEEEVDFCEFYNQEVEVRLYDSNLNSVDGNLSYVCFNQECRLGESKQGVFNGAIPSCVNGQIRVRAEGYADKSEIYSSNSESDIDIILARENEVEVEIKAGGSKLNELAMVVFTDENDKAKSVFLPDINKIKLKEGLYDVKAYAYSNSSINIPESSRRECRDLPRSGILGIFGSTKQECFDIEIPATTIEFGLIAGGSSQEYLLESELAKGKMVIDLDRLPSPRTVEDLQNNFALIETNGVAISFP